MWTKNHPHFGKTHFLTLMYNSKIPDRSLYVYIYVGSWKIHFFTPFNSGIDFYKTLKCFKNFFEVHNLKMCA